jgi:hypothetical protein
VRRHESRRFVPVFFLQGLNDHSMLPPSFAEVAVAVVAGLVGEPLVAPAAADDRTHREVAAVFGDDEVQGWSSQRAAVCQSDDLPASRRARAFQIGEDFVGNASDTGTRRLGFEQLPHLVKIDEPVLRARVAPWRVG